MEQTIYRGRTSLVKYWFLTGMGALLIMTGVQLINSPGARGTGYLFALPGFFCVGIAYLIVRATSYTVTSRRVIRRAGLLSPRTSEIAVSDVRTVRVDQSSTERLLGIGDVVVSRAGPSGREIVFAGIRRPQEVAEMIPGRRTKIAQGRLKAVPPP